MPFNGKLGKMRPMKLHNKAVHTPHFGGLFHSDVPGRTDKLNVSVPNSSYVIPADVVSSAHLGQGNTLAGSKVLGKMFPYSESMQQHNGKTSMFSQGGKVDIITAGGEWLVHPKDVERLGNGKISAGHQVLDSFVKNIRKKSVKETSKLPPPKKD